jgi:hypothetical protein
MGVYPCQCFSTASVESMIVPSMSKSSAENDTSFGDAGNSSMIPEAIIAAKSAYIIWPWVNSKPGEERP